RHSDRTLERRYHSALPYLASALGLIGIGIFATWPVLAFACLVIAIAGPIMANGPFWQIPRMLLTGPAAAGGIALINSIGSLTGCVGSVVVGGLKCHWQNDVWTLCGGGLCDSRDNSAPVRGPTLDWGEGNGTRASWT